MASLAQLRAQTLVFLATTSDDPLYTPSVLNGFLNDAYHAVVDEMQRINRSYLYADVLLTPDATTTQPWSSQPVLSYTLQTQNPPVTNFAYWLELRKTNDDGDLLKECRLEELRDAGNGFFAVTGTDEATQIRLSKDTELGINVYMKYGTWPLDMQADTDSPVAIPSHYHDVLPLEVCFAFALGGEGEFPPELRNRWIDRKGALMAHVGKRGTQVSRTQVDPFDVEQFA